MARSNADIRRRQIDTLKIFNDNVMELKPNEDYSIGFSAAGRTFQLDVHLSAHFPSEPPRVELSPPLSHPWVQPGSGHIQSAPGLINFTVHSDLGRVVDAIIRELQRTIKSAPNSATDAHNASNSSANSSASSSTSSAPSHSSSSASASSSSTTTPTAAAAAAAAHHSMPPDAHPPAAPHFHQPPPPLPDLNALSLDELRSLATDDSHLADFCAELPPLLQLDSGIDQLLADVDTLATANLAKAEQLAAAQLAKRELQQAVRQLGDEYEATNRRHQQLAEQFAPAHIRELLQIAAVSAESDCEQHVAGFLGGRTEVGEFLEQYIPAKVLGAVRKAKEDRLTHQLNALEKATF